MSAKSDSWLAKIGPLVTTGEWEAAYVLMSRADDAGEVASGEAFQQFAVCAYMTGREDTYVDLMMRAFDDFVAGASQQRAARAAFWIGLTLMFRGEFGRGGGWLARADKLIEELGDECVEAGYVLLPQVEVYFGKGDNERAKQLASEALAIGKRFRDDDLAAIARHLVGRARMILGDIEGGLSELDETMVAVIEGHLSPIVTGLVYCSVIEACQKYQILRRASEWTGALSSWCARQPELVAFTGRCLIHRSEILLFDGQWNVAEAEAGNAITRLAQGPANHHAGPAYYQLGEVHRLRGDLDAADASFRSASTLGFDPQPGLALMRMRQGNLRSAGASIRRALAAAANPVQRMRLLPAAFEIALAAEDSVASAAFCIEMETLAETYSSEVIDATSAEMRGDLSRAEGKIELAVQSYARAAALWRDMQAPYRLCRVRMRTARACADLGDTEGSMAEARAARDGFEKLGAEPDREAAEAVLRQVESGRSELLTPRQSQVLRFIARGLKNREIGKRLGLSERTIDRHVSDILTRIDVPTRSAAVAYALSKGFLEASDFE